MISLKCFLACVICCVSVECLQEMPWMHSLYLDRNGYYKLSWNVEHDFITFETLVRTRGYIGLGLSLDGNMAGSDMMLGWVTNGVAVIQDRFSSEPQQVPELDTQQDWELLYGAENDTHTVLRFRRKFNTCDKKDVPITNDTFRLIYAYHEEDVREELGSIHSHGPFQRGYRSVYLLNRVSQELPTTADLLIWDLKNSEVLLPQNKDTFYCHKLFRMPPMNRKHHMIRYEPLHQVGNEQYIHHIVVYECAGNDDEDFEESMRSDRHGCHQANLSQLVTACSAGFTLPSHVGYPMDPQSGRKYYLMETHYDNPSLHQFVRDSSGLRLYYTPRLRKEDAGILSIGLEPSWKHLIPPQQNQVVSEGHCIGQCTKQAFPVKGMQIFGVILHSHRLGKKMRLRHVRAGYEFPPIAQDDNYDFNYQEYRMVDRRVLPGDELLMECVYNSSHMRSLTLGGLSTRMEMCLAYAYYSPRISLAFCHSVPSLSTVLQSVGIDELWSPTLMIKSPSYLNNMTLEDRLIRYDWVNNFESFKLVSRTGSFQPLCWQHRRVMLPGTENLMSTYPNIKHLYIQRDVCQRRPDGWWHKSKPLPPPLPHFNSGINIIASSSLSGPRWTNIRSPGGSLIEIKDVFTDAVSANAKTSVCTLLMLCPVILILL